MKTIDIAASDYALSIEENDYTIETECAFKAGARYACTWINVDDELPEQNKFLIEEKNDLVRTKRLLAKTDCGSVIDTVRVLDIDGEWGWCPTISDEVFVSWRLLDYE